jgi:hypothetical protein
MKKLVLSTVCLLSFSLLDAAPFESNVGLISFARTVDDSEKLSKISITADTNDIDTLQIFETAELTIVLGDGTKTKSEIYLSKDNQISIKNGEELVVIGTLDEQKNLELAQGILPEYTIENTLYVLKIRFPAIEQ